jgi:CheY-like chemotaxis protein
MAEPASAEVWGTLSPIEILLVEDNPGDVRLTRECLKQARVANHLQVVTDGLQAMTYLRREGEHEAASRPDLILLDLNLPRRNGREVLAAIKNDAELRRIPVVILSSSTREEDVAGAYDLHANCYIAKPTQLDQFAHVLTSIEDFWLRLVRLPGRPDAA